MADTAGYPDTDAKPGLSSHNVVDAVHTNKRKRASRDQGPTTSRPAPGESARASSAFQRVSPGSANNTSASATEMSDQATASFLAAHNASTTDDNDMHHSSNASLDFGLHQNGGANSSNAGDTAAAALAHYSMTVPQATELSFQNQASAGEGTSFSMGDHGVHQPHGNSNESPPNTASHKPTVGSEEWHKVRRDNHKEVERRRRETINEGINELAKIVPGCEKNKGSILQRAVQFITQLKENESQNIEKWTLEKLLTEQAITELSASCEKFKAEMQRAWDECEAYKRACRNAGIVPEEFKDRENSGDQNGDS